MVWPEKATALGPITAELATEREMEYYPDGYPKLRRVSTVAALSSRRPHEAARR
jgi:hypothetical protein